ncbi:MAG: flagellar protein [Planctomycetes bacterium]|jgi:flagellar protein FlbD|nr:flagellar protein [Planctomycetota bacterium]
MITVTRLNGNRFVVNAELIRTVESHPDTTIRLINGDTIIVKESMQEVVELSIEYGRSLRKLLPPS